MKATLAQYINIRQWLLVFGAVAMGLAVSFVVSRLGPLTLLAVPLLVVVLVSFGYPEIGLFTFLFVTYINLSSVLIFYHGLPSIAKPFVGFLVLVIFVRRFIFKDEFHGWVQLALLLTSYGLLGSLSLLYVSDFDEAYLDLIDFLKDALIVILIVMIISRWESFRSMIWVLLAAGLLMGCISVFQRLTGTFTNIYWGFGSAINSSDVGYRLAGPIKDPNTFAQILVVLIPLALERYQNEKNLFLKLVAVVTLLILVFTITFTYSRGGFLALFVAVVVWLIKRPPSPQVVTLIIAAGILVLRMLPSNYTERILSLSAFIPGSTSFVTSDQSFRGRSSENLVAINMFLDHPITGIGPGNYSVYYQEYSRQLGIDPRRSSRSAHSLYLEVLAERGLPGIFIFGLIFYLTVRGLLRSEMLLLKANDKSMADIPVAVLASFIGYMTSALFLHGAYIRYYWVLMGIAWAVTKVTSSYLDKEKLREAPNR